MMKVQLFSDLHLELQGFYFIEEKDSDVIVLAGDIAVGLNGIKWAIEVCEQHKKPVIYVAGNHEFYHHDYIELLAEMRELAESCPQLHFLEQDEVVIDGTRFLGTTMWTDYLGDRKTTQEFNMLELGMNLNDHWLIRLQKAFFEPKDALAIHNRSVDWLKKKLSTPFDGRTVVVTHHGPSLTCAHRDYGINHISTGFLSDLDYLVEQADLWCFGHSHSNLDTKIGKCRLISNQKGYPRERLPVPFDAHLINHV